MKLEDIKVGAVYQHVKSSKSKLRVLEFSEYEFTFEWVEVDESGEYWSLKGPITWGIFGFLKGYKPVYMVEGFEV